MMISDVILRVFMIVLMLFLAFAYYRVSIDPQETAMTRVLHRILAKRYVRGPQMGATTQARLLAVMFVCLAILFVILAFSGVPTKTFGR
jgi:preprotein translocase subunit SecG